MQVNIIEIKGPWALGYVLDWHKTSSVYIGKNEFGHSQFDTTRTEVGEAIYQLKYKNDQSQIEPLAETMVSAIGSKFKTVSLVVPMPPSKLRSFQPAIELARKVADKMNLPFFERLLLKRGTTSQMKDFQNREDKEKALLGAFYIEDEIALYVEGEAAKTGRWDALIVDDLYDSGASFSAAAKVLRDYSKINRVFVAAFSRKEPAPKKRQAFK